MHAYETIANTADGTKHTAQRAVHVSRVFTSTMAYSDLFARHIHGV